MSNTSINCAQIVATIIVSMSAVSDGIHGSWTAPTIPKLLDPESGIAVDRSNANLLEMMYLIGTLAAFPFSMWSVDRLGRKRTVTVAAASNCVVWLMILSATNVHILYLARFLAGCNGNIGFVSAPMYISEIADKRVRGFLVALVITMILVGYVICYSVAPFVSIPTIAVVGLCFVGIQLLALPWMPKTPYFHLLRDNIEEARKALQFFRRCGPAAVEKELEELRMAVARQSQEKGGVRALFAVGSNRRGLIIILALTLSQHLSCHTVILMKLHTMFAGNRILSVNYIGIGFSLIMLVFTLIAAAIVDRFGRKLLLIASSLSTALVIIALAGYKSVDALNADWVPIAAVFTFAAVYRMGLGSVPIVVAGELFPTGVKGMAIAISDAISMISGTIVLFLFQVLDERAGMRVPFLLFALGVLGTASIVHFYVPETKGKTLEQIQLMLKGIRDQRDSDLENMAPLRAAVQMKEREREEDG